MTLGLRSVWPRIGLCGLALVLVGYILGEYIFLDDPKSATCLIGVTKRKGKRAMRGLSKREDIN